MFQDKKLQEHREIRKNEWEKFINDISVKCETVDQEFHNKEEELKDFYVDLEKKLHLSN